MLCCMHAGLHVCQHETHASPLHECAAACTVAIKPAPLPVAPAGTDVEAVERSRLECAAAAADTSADERVMAMMALHKLKSIATAQAAEIAAAQAELARLQQRSYPSLPPLGAPAAIAGSAAGVLGAVKAGSGGVGPACTVAAAAGGGGIKQRP